MINPVSDRILNDLIAAQELDTLDLHAEANRVRTETRILALVLIAEELSNISNAVAHAAKGIDRALQTLSDPADREPPSDPPS